MILHVFHYVKDTDRKPLLEDKKILFKTIFISIVSVEAITYHASYPHLIFRYGRFFRPCKTSLKFSSRPILQQGA